MHRLGVDPILIPLLDGNGLRGLVIHTPATVLGDPLLEKSGSHVSGIQVFGNGRQMSETGGRMETPVRM